MRNIDLQDPIIAQPSDYYIAMKAKMDQELKKPTYPPSAYCLYSQARRRELRAENPSMAQKLIFKIIKKDWKTVNKASFQATARQYFQEYRVLIGEWKERLGLTTVDTREGNLGPASSGVPEITDSEAFQGPRYKDSSMSSSNEHPDQDEHYNARVPSSCIPKPELIGKNRLVSDKASSFTLASSVNADRTGPTAPQKLRVKPHVSFSTQVLLTSLASTPSLRKNRFQAWTKKQSSFKTGSQSLGQNSATSQVVACDFKSQVVLPPIRMVMAVCKDYSNPRLSTIDEISIRKMLLKRPDLVDPEDVAEPSLKRQRV